MNLLSSPFRGANFSPHLQWKIFTPLICAAIISGCAQRETMTNYASYVDTTVSVYGAYTAIKLPVTKGVKIANPIQLALGPDSILYGANQTGEIYSLRDTDRDGLEDEALLYCNVKDYGLRSPAGFAYRGDTVYIGTAQEIRVFLDQNKDGRADTSWTFFDDIPNSEHPYEWTCGLTFGPDNWLYLALSTDSWNAAPSPDPNGYRGSILKISPDGKRIEQVATGIRSVYDLNFNVHGDLFFIDNEGGGNPTEELNLVSGKVFFGHNPKKYKFDSVTGPVLSLRSEVAPSGIAFNDSRNDFGGTAGNLFVSFYGPGERWTRGGLAHLAIERQDDGTYSFQESYIADIPKLSALAFGRDGALYAAQHGKADYWYNAVYENQGNFYKLVYDPVRKTSNPRARQVSTPVASESSVESGKQLFAELACLGCHAVDGVTDLLGPNLKDAGKRFNRSELLDEIVNPSRIIKPSMMAVRVFKTNGQTMLGRVVNAGEKTISLMLIGNQVVEIPRHEILKTENEKKSLMYEGLTNGLEEPQREALLDYIVSLGQND